jgi:hypothetical protein
MGRKRQAWQVGDVFSVPTSDGWSAIGQVIGREPDLPRSATVALFDERHKSVDLDRHRISLSPETLFAVLFVTTHNLDSGNWCVLDHRAVAIDPRRNPHEQTRKDGFVGAKVIGASIVGSFVNAYFGLEPWDDWKDPNYMDSLLISSAAKPLGRLVYKN